MAQPKITKMEFLKKSMLGFPILPIILEGNETFCPQNSIYEWEEKTIGNDDTLESSKHKKLKLENLLSFTPKEESYVGKSFRLTCTPWNAEATESGDPFTAETGIITLPPIDASKFIFRERISKSEMCVKPEDLAYFRVVQYNTLAGYLATESYFCPSSPAESLSNDYRLPIINLELKMYQPDIITLQEVEETSFQNYYKPYLSHECNMDGQFYSKADRGIDGLATFFNRQKFELSETNRVIIRDEMRLNPFFDNIKDEKLLKQLSARPNVLLVSVLKSKASEEVLLVVANTHLYAKADCEHIRLLQMVTCTNYIERMVSDLMTRNPRKIPLILFCGDLNCRPPFGGIRFLTTGKVAEDDKDWISKEYGSVTPGIKTAHNLNLMNSHSTVDNILTNIVKNFEGCLDYIFYQRDLDEILQLVKVHPPTSKAEIAGIIGVKTDQVFLPNFHAPSDHLPLIVDFRFEI